MADMYTCYTQKKQMAQEIVAAALAGGTMPLVSREAKPTGI
jgi:hypothetical protein